MTDQQTPPEGEGQGKTPVQDRTDLSKRSISEFPTDIQDYIRQLRRENRKAHEDRKAADLQRQQQEQAKLADEKQWEALAGKYKTQIDELAPRADRLDAMEQFVRDMAQKRIDALPTQWQNAVPEFSDPLQTLDWLEKSAPLMAQTPPPNLNPGAQGDSSKPSTSSLMPEDLALAKAAGMTPEQFAQYKARKKPEGAM